jgi:hypothetical protein
MRARVSVSVRGYVKGSEVYEAVGWIGVFTRFILATGVLAFEQSFHRHIVHDNTQRLLREYNGVVHVERERERRRRRRRVEVEVKIVVAKQKKAVSTKQPIHRVESRGQTDRQRK